MIERESQINRLLERKSQGERQNDRVIERPIRSKEVRQKE
jgi:hypothetical protein